LRDVRRRQASGEWLSVSGADPLNLAGILTPGPKLAALTGNRLLYRDGLPVALFAAGEVQFLETLGAAGEWDAHKALLRTGGASSSTIDSMKPVIPGRRKAASPESITTDRGLRIPGSRPSGLAPE
jgi:hypothetical protein